MPRVARQRAATAEYCGSQANLSDLLNDNVTSWPISATGGFTLTRRSSVPDT